MTNHTSIHNPVLEEIRAIKDFDGLAKFLGVTHGTLRYILYDKKYLRYRNFEIPKRKKDQTRTISVPTWALANIQKKLLEVFQAIYNPRKSVYGFTKGQSIVTNAKYHRKGGKIRYLLNIDLQDFFPSIHLGRVKGLLKSEPYRLRPRVATWIAQIVTTYNNGLPQGASTSPIISNMLCNKLDTQLSRLAKKYHCRYTRYADDLVFSSSDAVFPPFLAFIDPITDKLTLGAELTNIITEDNNFRINSDKVKLQTPRQRQEVTGLVVNDFVNVPRQFIREVRAMLHDWDMNGIKIASTNHSSKRKKYRSPNKLRLDFRAVVRGKIEFIGMVRGKNDRIYKKLARKYNKVIKYDAIKFFDKTSKPDVFISYNRKDIHIANEIYQKLLDNEFNVWMDTRALRGGKPWKAPIFKAIAETDCFIALVSDPYRKRLGVKNSIIRQEIDAILSRITQESKNDEPSLIPVRLDKKYYPKILSDIHGYNFPEEFDKIILCIDEVMRKIKE